MPEPWAGAGPEVHSVGLGEVGLSVALLAVLAPLLGACPSAAEPRANAGRFSGLRKDWAMTVLWVLVAQFSFWGTVVTRHRLHELGTPAAFMPVARSVVCFACCLAAWAARGELRSMAVPKRTVWAGLAGLVSCWACAGSTAHASPAGRRVADMFVPLVAVLAHGAWRTGLSAASDAVVVAGCGVLIAWPSARADEAGFAMLALRAFSEAMNAVLQGGFFASPDGPSTPLLALLTMQSGLGLPLLVVVGHVANPGLLSAFGIASAGLCLASTELVRRVGAVEAMVLLALTRWPLPLGASALRCCLGPLAVVLLRQLRRAEKEKAGQE